MSDIKYITSDIKKSLSIIDFTILLRDLYENISLNYSLIMPPDIF